MSELSEEDITDIAEKIANFGWSDYDDFVKNKKAIQGLLDLYNKEKEKNEKQQKEIEKNKKIFNQYEKRVNELEREIATNCISKDKVREKIEELEKQIENINNKNDGYWEDTSIILDEQKQVLEELLGE